jgi:hypothetical protein
MHSLDEFSDLSEAKVVLVWDGRELTQEDVFAD